MSTFVPRYTKYKDDDDTPNIKITQTQVRTR